MASLSKQKGAQFERDICKRLSRWVSDGKSEDLFWRSAMSGGRATLRRGSGKSDADRQAGDITAIGQQGFVLTDFFVIECKFYRRLDMDQIVYGRGRLWTFWHDLIVVAHDVGKCPMLIGRENWRPPILVVDRRTSEEMDAGGMFFRLQFGSFACGGAVYQLSDLLDTKEGLSWLEMRRNLRQHRAVL